MRSCPSNFSVYGTLFLKLLAKRPRDWDLFISYALWTIREYKRGNQIRWSGLPYHLVRRAGAKLQRSLIGA
jgi:hypothetical protein